MVLPVNGMEVMELRDGVILTSCAMLGEWRSSLMSSIPNLFHLYSKGYMQRQVHVRT